MYACFIQNIYKYTWHKYMYKSEFIQCFACIFVHHSITPDIGRQCLPCLFPPFATWHALKWDIAPKNGISVPVRDVGDLYLGPVCVPKTHLPQTQRHQQLQQQQSSLEWNCIPVHGPSLKDETQRSWRRAEWTDQIASKKYGSEFTALINPVSVFLRCRVFNCFHIGPDEHWARKRMDIALQNNRTIQRMHDAADAYLHDFNKEKSKAILRRE